VLALLATWFLTVETRRGKKTKTAKLPGLPTWPGSRIYAS
jgi:hypothetical protein